MLRYLIREKALAEIDVICIVSNSNARHLVLKTFNQYAHLTTKKHCRKQLQCDDVKKPKELVQFQI